MVFKNQKNCNIININTISYNYNYSHYHNNNNITLASKLMHCVYLNTNFSLWGIKKEDEKMKR